MPAPRGRALKPSTWAMMLVGFAGLGYAARRPAKKTLLML
jgi:hypothetical protein